MPQVFHDCNGWGNHISWTSWQKKLVYGHHTPTPGVGDYWEHRMRSGKIMVFRFTKVLRDIRVPDYFEATVAICGYKDDLPENYHEVLRTPEKSVPSWVFWLLAVSGTLTWVFVHYNLY